MPVLEAHFHFSLTDLWVDGALLGTREELTFSGRRAFVQLPAREDDFGLNQSASDFRFAIAGGKMASDGGWAMANVAMIRIGLFIPTNLVVPAGSTDASLHKAVHELLRQNAEIARSLLKTYIDLVSVNSSQYWLGTQAHRPEVAWLTLVYDEHGQRIKVGYNDARSVIVHKAESALTEQTHRDLLRRTECGEEPPIAEAFLRDADYLGLQGRDPAHTLLDAAIACELKIKGTLLDLASPSQKLLVDLAVGKSREFTQAAYKLFDVGLKAVVGRSLKEDDRALFKAVTALFEARNKIAHRGESPDMAEVRQHVATARQVFAWLDSLGERAEPLSRVE